MALVNTFFEKRVERLFDLAGRIEEAFAAAGLEYRLIGGLATYVYVEASEPDAGRLTKDLDIAVKREDLQQIARAVEPFGLIHRHVASVDMLIQADDQRAVRLVFTGEKIRSEYVEAAPELGPECRIRGLRVIPLQDLVRMKLTSFRLRDQVHLKDLDEAGLITPEIEAGVSPVLRARLTLVRSQE